MDGNAKVPSTTAWNTRYDDTHTHKTTQTQRNGDTAEEMRRTATGMISPHATAILQGVVQGSSVDVSLSARQIAAAAAAAAAAGGPLVRIRSMPAARASIRDVAKTLTTDDAWNDNEKHSRRRRLRNNQPDVYVSQAPP